MCFGCFAMRNPPLVQFITFQAGFGRVCVSSKRLSFRPTHSQSHSVPTRRRTLGKALSCCKLLALDCPDSSEFLSCSFVSQFLDARSHINLPLFLHRSPVFHQSSAHTSPALLAHHSRPEFLDPIFHLSSSL